jgi:hypothetical protein
MNEKIYIFIIYFILIIIIFIMGSRKCKKIEPAHMLNIDQKYVFIK